MSVSIGARVYLISVYHKSDRRKALAFDTDAYKMPAPQLISKFISSHAAATQSVERERSWYFEEKESGAAGNSKGYIHYGTFGFESNFIDSKTKKRNYRRQVSDVEEIPLFYEFWFPSRARHAFSVFQSFQGRSCITMVVSKIQEMFEANNPGLVMSFKKLLANDASGGIYSSVPVKKLRLIKRRAPADLAEKYLGIKPSSNIDFEVSFAARRKGSLGAFSALTGNFKADRTEGVITYDGVDFEEAVAEIRVGGRTRRVGVFGIGSDAGAIDLSDTIEKGLDGHPTFESLKKESDSLLRDFHKKISETSL